MVPVRNLVPGWNRGVLFDPRPKSSRKELFNREKELDVLDKSVERGDPLITVLGIRRIGKTSLLKSLLEEWTGLYIDMRGVRRELDLYERISEGLEEGLGKLRRFLEGIRGINIVGVEVEIKYRGKDSISLVGLLEELNKHGERIVVVFDEAQLIRPPLSAEIKNAIAYAYDNLENITIILSGSEIGLLRDFIGIDNPDSPLYGRYTLELLVERFTRDLSLEFLRQGFREARIRVDEKLLEEAVEFFDGIVGWLVFFGKSYIDGIRDLEKIKEIAIKVAARELQKLDWKAKTVLRAIAEGAQTWSSIRRFVEEKRKTTIPKSTLTRAIRRLERLGIIKDYKFLDPVYMEAAKNL